MLWNWQKEEWPKFFWDTSALDDLEKRFIHLNGKMEGVQKYINEEQKLQLIVDLLSGEAVTTSAIEGEVLNRESVQSSVLRNFGLKTDYRKVNPAEQGVANLITDVYKNYKKPLTHHLLFNWHKMLCLGRTDLTDVARYRRHEDPMQVVSGRLDQPRIHFEAPPSAKVKAFMGGYINWWKLTAAGMKGALPGLTRTAIAHLYFVSIHPFEDGNGRLGRALAEKALAESQEKPSLIALSSTLVVKRNEYYDALENNNKNLDITDWLLYFANAILSAQEYSIKSIAFIIDKTRLYDRVRGQLNPRQEKVLARMFREGVDGFKGGLSAENYIRISGAPRATVTRDLQDLCEKKVLIKSGKLKSTRYFLNISNTLTFNDKT